MTTLQDAGSVMAIAVSTASRPRSVIGIAVTSLRRQENNRPSDIKQVPT